MPARTRGSGPDFGVRCVDGRITWVEATAPTAGDERKPDGRRNGDKVRVPTGQLVYASETDRTIMLRYLGAIREKRRQWKRAVENALVHPDDGFLIAISGAMVADAWFEVDHHLPRIVRVLFGLGEPTFSVAVGGSDVVEVGIADQPTVGKANGAQVPSRLFLDGDCAPDVSAVLFAPWYLKERPEKRGHPPGWDYIFALNAHAHRPFPFNAPKCGRVFFQGLQCDDRRGERQ